MVNKNVVLSCVFAFIGAAVSSFIGINLVFMSGIYMTFWLSGFYARKVGEQ